MAGGAAGGVGDADEDTSESVMHSLLAKPLFHLGMAGACAALAAWSVGRISMSTAAVLDVMLAVACTLAVPWYLWRYWTLRRDQRRRDREGRGR